MRIYRPLQITRQAKIRLVIIRQICIEVAGNIHLQDDHQGRLEEDLGIGVPETEKIW